MKTKFAALFLTALIFSPFFIAHADTTALPTIKLTGKSTFSILAGTQYTDAGATALDTDGTTDISSSIVTVNPVDISTVGTYTVTYNVIDSTALSAVQVTRIVNVVAPTSTTIHLTIATNTGNIYDQDETVSSCESGPGIIAVSAYCAVVQAEPTSNWTLSGDDEFLNSITTFVNNDSNNGVYWGWFTDLTYGTTSFSAHTLTSGEHLLLNYNTNPLKLTVDNSSPTQNDTVTLKLYEFGFDSSWNAVWNPSTTGTITVNGTAHAVGSDGSFSLLLDSTSPYTISGSKTGFIDSNTITLTPTAVVTTSGGGGGGGSGTPPPVFSIANALSYLTSTQGSDGSFGGSPLYTDWASIALSAGNVSGAPKTSVLNYMAGNLSVSSTLTDNERHAMALLSLGQNPYSFHGTDYITPIVNSFDGTQFGDSSLVNDDIFALIPLSSAGYTASDTIISKDITFVLSKQNSDGSWNGGVDMTAAAVQSLKPFSSISGVSNALTKASTYIQNSQASDGGFGGIYSTSWAGQAMSALGASWTNNGKSINDYFATQQATATDGAVLPSSETLQNRIWATSYAIPSALGMSWSAIMHSVAKPVIQQQTVSTSGGSTGNNQQNIIATPPPVVVVPAPIVVAPIVAPVVVAPKITTETVVTPPVKKVALKTQSVVQKIISPVIPVAQAASMPPTQVPLSANAQKSGFPVSIPLVGGGIVSIGALAFFARRFMIKP